MKSSNFERNSEIFNQIITCLTLENIFSKTLVKEMLLKERMFEGRRSS